MKYFSLQEYKTIKQRLIYLDILIKNETSNKDMFLQEHFISPTSYRRAKNDGKKIGNQILKDLSSYFNYKIPTDTLIDEIEQRLNEIYFNTVYKKYKSYEEDVKYLDSLILENYIINPIVKVFRLLLEVYSDQNPYLIKISKDSDYKEICVYDKYYTNDLLKIKEILDLTFIDNINSNVYTKTYHNELSYYTLAAKLSLNEKYIEALYFGNIAKEFLIKQENYVRLYFLNVILLRAYNKIGNYKEAYLLADKQLYSLKNINEFKMVYDNTVSQYIVSLIGLKEFKKLFDYIYEKKSLKFYEIIVLFFCKYKFDFKNYTSFINDYIEIDDLSDERKNIINMFNEYIFSKNDSFFNNKPVGFPTMIFETMKKVEK